MGCIGGTGLVALQEEAAGQSILMQSQWCLQNLFSNNGSGEHLWLVLRLWGARLGCEGVGGCGVVGDGWVTGRWVYCSAAGCCGGCELRVDSAGVHLCLLGGCVSG